MSLSIETKQKISESKKGTTSWNKGISHSEDTREKISTANKGRESPKKGISYSDEDKQSFSLGHKTKIRCIELDKIFETKIEAAHFLGLKTSKILVEHAKSGELYKGYHWELISKSDLETPKANIKLPSETINVD